MTTKSKTTQQAPQAATSTQPAIQTPKQFEEYSRLQADVTQAECDASRNLESIMKLKRDLNNATDILAADSIQAELQTLEGNQVQLDRRRDMARAILQRRGIELVSQGTQELNVAVVAAYQPRAKQADGEVIAKATELLEALARRQELQHAIQLAVERAPRLPGDNSRRECLSIPDRSQAIGYYGSYLKSLESDFLKGWAE